MICPVCDAPGSRVVDSRRETEGDLQRVRRRRHCSSCGSRWVTFERFSHLVQLEGESTRSDRIRSGDTSVGFGPGSTLANIRRAEGKTPASVLARRYGVSVALVEAVWARAESSKPVPPDTAAVAHLFPKGWV